MSALKAVTTVQAIVLFVYGLPYLLVPKWTTTIPQQLPLPENYINGALWYWWLNGVVTGVFAVAVFVTGRKAHA